MPIATAPSTSRRLLSLLSLLQTPREWPARVLAERLEVSERTVRRDVDRLRELEYVIDASRGPDGGYRLEAGARLPPMLFDDEQAIAVAMTLQTAGSLGAGLEEAAGRALRTLRRLMPAHLAHRVDGLAAMTAGRPPAGPGETDPAVLLRIGEAIRAGVELRFTYDSPGRDTGAEPAPIRRIEPHHVLLRGGRWYLIGWRAERDEWRVYRVDRISPATHTGRRFTPHSIPGGDPAAWLSARFKGSDGADAWPCRGDAVLAAPLADVVPYVGDGTAERVDDGRCRVGLGAWSWDALAATLARFDADLSDVRPAALREAFARLATRAAAATAAAAGTAGAAGEDP